MNNNRDRLTNIQITALTTSSIIGATVLSLPRVATQQSKAGGAIVIFVSGIVILVISCIFALLARKFPNQTIAQYPEQIIGKVFGKLIILISAMYFISVTGAILRAFSDALKINILQKTPLEFIMVSMLVVVIYLIGNGISSLAKISEAFVPIILVAFVLLLGLSLQRFNIEELLPSFSKGIMPLIKAIPKTAVAYSGFEIILIAIPFMKDTKQAVKYSAIGVAIPIIVYTSLVTISIGVFGVDTLIELTYPTITLAKSIEFPGTFIERFDIVFIIMWIIAAFTSIATFYYMASFTVTRMFGLKNYKPFIYILLPLIYMIAILPQNIFQINYLLIMLDYYAIGLSAIIILLFIMTILTGKGGQKNA